MPYVLGIDIGTHTTLAAVSRLGDADAAGAEVVPLGDGVPWVATALWATPEGGLLGGVPDGTERVPDGYRVITGFADRVGDEVPLIVDGEPVSAEELTAWLVGWVVEQVAYLHGERPEHVVVTYPAGWGPHRVGSLHEALLRLDLPPVTPLAEPVAAAEGYAYAEPVAVGTTLAVYRLGASRFAATLVRRTRGGAFEVVPGAVDESDLGGTDLDDAVVELVRERAGRALPEPDPDDPAAVRAMAWLRRECAAAAQRLGAADEVLVRVRPGDDGTALRLGRAEVEAAIEPALRHSVDTLVRTVRGAGLAPGDLDAVLLAGGATRAPLVGRLLSGALPCRVVTESDPEATLARGAALAARRPVDPSIAVPVSAVPVSVAAAPASPTPVGERLLDGAGMPAGEPEPPARPPVELTPLDLPSKSGGRRATRPSTILLALLVIVLVIAVGLLVSTVMGGGPRLR